MEYARMVCWVRPHEKKELIEVVDGQFSLVFAKNYDDFKSKINDDDYLVVSLKLAHKYISGFSKMLENCCQNIQILLDCNGQVFGDVVGVFTDAKKRYHNYTVTQIVENFITKA
jgi:hypothetical protein